MKKLALVFVTICLCLTSAIAADLVSEERNVGNFSGIGVSAGINLHLLQGKALTIKVEAKSEEMLERVNTEIKNGTLHITMKSSSGFRKNTGPINVYVAADNLEKLSVSSGASAKTLTKLQTDNIKIDCSSGSSTSVELDANNIKCSVSSGASCKIAGKANDFSVSGSSGSSGSYNDLIAESVSASTSSGASIKVHANKHIEAKASSGGSISYWGNPEKKSTSTSSGGSVSKR